MREGVIKIDLKRAIILEDARRIERGDAIINSIRNLAAELERKYPDLYELDVLAQALYFLCRSGYAQSRPLKYDIDLLIVHLCETLGVKRDDLILTNTLTLGWD
tara:strand:- start:43 stop:354 length:312 start_codon:yes stop_codon:yes gene_type:complete